MEDRNLKISFENENGFPLPDPSFKLEASHYSILKEARENGSIFDKNKYAYEINRKNLDGTIKKNMIKWNETITRNMSAAGYLIDAGNGTYKVNPLVEIMKTSSGFTPGSDHIKLLTKHADGVIKTIDLKNEHRHKKEYEAKRQYKMIDGMITNLYQNGYFERIGRGEYKLTDLAFEAIEKSKWKGSARSFNTNDIKPDLKITGFDRHILDIINDDWMINGEKLREHPKSKSIEARIATLEKAGLITNGQISEALVKRINKALLFIKDNQLTLEKLTPEQIILLKDIRIFLNLTFLQISKYIYQGNRSLASADLEFLIKNKVLKLDQDMAVYIFDYQGIRLSNLLEGDDAVRYKTKLFSRKEEVEHDMLIYTAYKEYLKSLPAGTEIISVKNDRQMRRDDAQKYGHMIDGYPDLRVEFKAPGDIVSKFYDIEIDCGYDGKTIDSKIHSINKGQESLGKRHSGFGWYCKSIGQAAKVAKIMTKDSTKRITKSRNIELFVLEKNGKLHKIMV